jgi:multidrug efflux pump subunit AcrB
MNNENNGAPSPHVPHHNWMTRIVEVFLKGNLSVILILISLVAGGAALLITPREEDPQIIVPIADVLISMPGASAREVERQVSTRLEKLLYQIDGVEYVYSTSYPSVAMVTVRFYVGENREDSLFKVQSKIQANIDKAPPGVAGWVVRPVEIDDAPIVSLTLYSDQYSDYELRRMAEEMEIRLQAVKNAGRTYVVGGRSREISVHVSPSRMAGRGVTLSDAQRAIQAANASLPAGDMVQGDVDYTLQAGRFLTSAHDVGNLVVGVHDQRPVFLREIADVKDGPAEPSTYTRVAFGPGSFTEGDLAAEEGGRQLPPGIERYKDYPSVTVAVAKRKGTNAVWVSEEVIKEAQTFAREALPEGVHLRVTRDNGKTADEKVNELVEALVVAILTVVILLAYTLGWREGLIIALAIPITFSFTLLLNYLLGYTINRVTLFALILSLGLVVDDPIVDVENIHRHFTKGGGNPFKAVIDAVNEVRPPIILATFAVIISFIPMFFITGMMGPYMAPMALNVPVAMLMSLFVAFTVTPWLSYHMLKSESDHAVRRPGDGPPPAEQEEFLFRLYRRIMHPLFESRRLRWTLLGGVLGLLVLAVLLVVFRLVPLKMLPFDNKNELQVVIDMPEGTTLESTEAATHALADYLVRIPEVTDVTTYAGASSPIDFNGLVRHYYLRQGPTVADIRFSLLGKKNRSQQSHAISLRLRNDLHKIADRCGANIKIVEIPPGPPVIATLVAEVYGGIGQPYDELTGAAKQVRGHMETMHGVVDVDDISVAPQVKLVYNIDRTKAALHGISAQEIAQSLQALTSGGIPSSLRIDNQVHPVLIRLQLPRADRTLQTRLEQLMVRGATGEGVFLSELGTFSEERIDQPIYHKNLTPVVYVFGDTAGLPPPEAVLALGSEVDKDPKLEGFQVNWSGEGEWDITLRAFRDLGIAFGVAVLGIYILLLYQTQSYILPAIQLIALPLSIIGIFPGFWLLNVIVGHTVGGWGDPVYFTATAMIGMIALAGIATRNSILLIEFVEVRKEEGHPLMDSLIEAGALRTRPIFLTSIAAMLGAWPITLDPIFSGLAWALIFGIIVSTMFTLVVVPVVYYMAYASKSTTLIG